MRHRSTLFVLAALATLIFTVAATPTEFFEDFEGQTIAAPATFDFATGSSSDGLIASPGLDGTQRKAVIGNAAYTIIPDARTSGDVTQEINFHAQYTNGARTTFIFLSGPTEAAPIAHLTIIGLNPNRVWALTHGTSCSGSQATQSVTPVYGDTKFRFIFNFATNMVTMIINDGADQVGPKSFLSCPGSGDDGIKKLSFQRAESGTAVGFDQFLWNGDEPLFIEPEELPSPSEFDAGFVFFVTSIGFISPSSQMFFTVALVGLTTVGIGAGARFMSSGKFKNLVILGSGLLVAVFATLIGFLELWIYIVAFMLGIFGVQGLEAARNTWREVRDTIAQRSATLDAETGAEVAGPRFTGGQPGSFTQEDPDSANAEAEQAAEAPAAEPSPEPSGDES